MFAFPFYVVTSYDLSNYFFFRGVSGLVWRADTIRFLMSSASRFSRPYPGTVPRSGPFRGRGLSRVFARSNRSPARLRRTIGTFNSYPWCLSILKIDEFGSVRREERRSAGNRVRWRSLRAELVRSGSAGAVCEWRTRNFHLDERCCTLDADGVQRRSPEDTSRSLTDALFPAAVGSALCKG